MRYNLLRKQKLEFLVQYRPFFNIQKLSASLRKENKSQQKEKTCNGFLPTIAFKFVGNVLEIFE